jgi:uncharacterized protein YukE
MPNQFNQGTVQQYGGVAWAKQQAEALSPQAIGDQIKAYNDVNTSLNNIVDTLNKANSSLQSAWSGDAATAATQTFSDTSNHAQNVITTVKNTITQLTTAQNAATTAQQAMRNVPDEKPVPSGGFFSGITNTVSDIFTGTDPVQQAQQHNLAARNQAADVLNKLSSSYETAANNMNTIANGGQGSGFTPSSPPSSGSFNLGSGSYGGGSGAAAGYGFTGGSSGGGKTTREPSFGGVTNGVFHEGTSLSHTGTVTPPPSSTPPGLEDINTTTTTTTPGPIFGTPGGGLPIPPGEETSKPGGGSAFGDGLEEGGGKTGTSKISSNVFGEEGFGDESGGGGARRTASNLGGNLEGEEGAEGGRVGGSAGGGAEGEQSAMRGAGGRRGGGSSGEEELGSSKYSRGKFFGGDEPGSGEEEWVQPSIGGNESLLVKDSGRGAGTGRVTSAYDGATDADGNPLRMARGVGRRGASRDEDDERGERPDYLKEDPEWWQSAQQVAPPVVD